MSALVSSSFHALGTTAVIVTTDADALAATRAVLIPRLRAVDLACSRFRPDSELVGLNRSAGAPVAVSPVFWDALEVALRVAWTTGGLVDPTLGRSLRLAGYDRTFACLQLRDGRLVRPSFEPGGGWRNVELDSVHRTVRLPEGVELDLGAVAKALVADQIAVAAATAAGTGVLISLGGDVAVAGEAPDGGWTIRIAADHRTPLETEGPTVAILAGGLASSSTQVRRWQTVAGTVNHILDPATGRPVSSDWATVSVAAASCVEANAASTAACVLGNHAADWLECRGLAARLARPDGSVVRTGAWPADTADAA
jgi:thiamine biosynthesis lipoprotein